MSAATMEAVTTGGWYERVDGTVAEYRWSGGRATERRVVASWADVPSREDDLRADLAYLAAR